MQVIDFKQFLKKQHRIVTNLEDDSVGNLYLGNIGAASPDELELFKVKAVLTVARNTGLGYKEEYIKHLIIDADDIDDYQIGQHFHKTFDFIDQNLKETNVLVHCFAGVSRSVAVVAAYMIRKHQVTTEDALCMIKGIRQIAGPNDGFVQQLKKYELKYVPQ